MPQRAMYARVGELQLWEVRLTEKDGDRECRERENEEQVEGPDRGGEGGKPEEGHT